VNIPPVRILDRKADIMTRDGLRKVLRSRVEVSALSLTYGSPAKGINNQNEIASRSAICLEVSNGSARRIGVDRRAVLRRLPSITLSTALGAGGQ